MTHLHPLHLLLLISAAAAAAVSTTGVDEAHVSAVVAEKGLAFAKDVLIGEAVRSLTPLRLPGVEKAVRVPFLGGVRVAASNITLFHLDVGDNSAVYPGDSGLVVVASSITANISMHWSYCYDSWLFPIEIADSGTASILVIGGVFLSPWLLCGCYVKDLVISLDGGASWFYQGFINAFRDHIKSAVEKAIPENIIEGAGKLDSFLQSFPRTVNLDEVAALNMTFVNDPHYGNSSIEFDINGLITSAVAKTTNLQKHPHLSLSCGGASKMLLLSLDEDVLNSALEVYFKAGSMHWVVDKVPDQSLLNTASWKFIIPRLYWNYPNDDMLLNISMASSPVISITSENIGATINTDMIIDVIHNKEIVPVACISVVVSASGIVETSSNKVYGRVGLDNFSLALKWSKIGNFHMSLIQSNGVKEHGKLLAKGLYKGGMRMFMCSWIICQGMIFTSLTVCVWYAELNNHNKMLPLQGVIRVFLNTVCMPYLNSRLGNGFILPVFQGFTLNDVYVVTSAEQLTLCSDVAFANASSWAALPRL
ncbi:hypothetical protein U9M48_028729 [Paspalum notatum var. saurae]|uniref:Lipid-binding serum glycoprotein C-terminal domain-containing protein n=1 Tax=Paspalum notatum var. saurae TaxID=547442 RepID=A0AAQ3X216_PASNO